MLKCEEEGEKKNNLFLYDHALDVSVWCIKNAVLCCYIFENSAGRKYSQPSECLIGVWDDFCLNIWSPPIQQAILLSYLSKTDDVTVLYCVLIIDKPYITPSQIILLWFVICVIVPTSGYWEKSFCNKILQWIFVVDYWLSLMMILNV